MGSALAPVLAGWLEPQGLAKLVLLPLIPSRQRKWRGAVPVNWMKTWRCAIRVPRWRGRRRLTWASTADITLERLQAYLDRIRLGTDRLRRSAQPRKAAS